VINTLNAELNSICHLLASLGAYHILHVSRIRVKKEAEKFLKYKELTIEIQRTWNVKAKVIPVIKGATVIISKSFRKYVSNIPGNHEVKELQKTAILGAAHILRNVLT
jgi:hypothetical protein